MGGLGTLQTEILASLEEAKRDRRGYRGFGGESGDHWPPGHKWTLPGWVLIAGNTVRLGLVAYDLRASRAFLARRHGNWKPVDHASPSFKAGFSRAVAGLIKRGLLVQYNRLLPIEDYDEGRLRRRDQIHDLRDGKLLEIDTRQTRFVYCTALTMPPSRIDCDRTSTTAQVVAISG
jgi:hypothetical protein